MRAFGVADGGIAVGGGAAPGVRVGAAPGVCVGAGGTVVTVSGGNAEVLADGLGGSVVLGLAGVAGAELIVLGVDTTVPLVEALSPLLTMTAVAMAPSAATVPATAVTGRQRLSTGQSDST